MINEAFPVLGSKQTGQYKTVQIIKPQAQAYFQLEEIPPAQCLQFKRKKNLVAFIQIPEAGVERISKKAERGHVVK